MARYYVRILIPVIVSWLAVISGCRTPIFGQAPSDRTRNSVVRVVTRNGSGTGFFVKGPDGHVYAVTAFHVIAEGGKLELLRYVDAGKAEHYVESYPEVELVVYDREADLAILRARNVPDRKMPALALAEPHLDEPLRSYGFTNSSMVGALGLTVKDGKVLDLVQLRVVDHRMHTVIKQHAIQGIIVSSALEPGFSGGPTVNRQGEVIGVNVTKDLAYDAQNGAVHATVLRKLLARITPPTEPTVDDVASMLDELQTKVLRAPVSDRSKLFESDMLSLSELETLRKYADILWRSKDSASLQLALSMLPGRTLETSLSPEVNEQIQSCRKHFNPIHAGPREVDAAAACADLALRPLAWDLVATTLHWDGRQHPYVVSSIEQEDPQLHHYVAKIAVADSTDTFFSLPLVVEGGRLKLRLFRDGGLFAMDSASKWTVSDFTGSWTVASHRVEDVARQPVPAGTIFASGEKLSISIAADGNAQITHDVTSEVFAPEGRPWQCTNQNRVALLLTQVLVGSYSNGAVRTINNAFDTSRGRPACSERCGLCGLYAPDRLAFFKRLGEQLIMYRADGNGTIQQQAFTRNPG